MDIKLKRALKKDCELLFNWANDEEVRKKSFSLDKILYEDHIKWFNNKINSDKCFIFILYFDEIPVGQIRIDIERANGLISYSIDKDFRGKGLSIIMLSKLETEVKNDEKYIDKLVGYVKFDNITSQKAFERLKYEKITHSDFLEYKKILNKRFYDYVEQNDD